MHLKIRRRRLARCRAHTLLGCEWDWRVDLWFWFWGTFGFGWLWYWSSWRFIRSCWQQCSGRCRAKLLQCSAHEAGLHRSAAPHVEFLVVGSFQLLCVDELLNIILLESNLYYQQHFQGHEDKTWQPDTFSGLVYRCLALIMAMGRDIPDTIHCIG